jgi:MtN3 and saliva related transmembrane protein
MIGVAAAILTTLCWVPQAIKVLRDRDTSSLSLATFLVLIAGIILWLTYGILIGSWPIILSNVISLPLNLAILGMKLKYG